MQFLFEKLSVDEVGVSFNDDASVAYVVKILSRRPANLETFKDAPLFGGREAYVTLARRASERLQVEYYRELERKYAIKWLEPSRQVARMSMADVDE
jgi:hypothetical protein